MCSRTTCPSDQTEPVPCQLPPLHPPPPLQQREHHFWLSRRIIHRHATTVASMAQRQNHRHGQADCDKQRSPLTSKYSLNSSSINPILHLLTKYMHPELRSTVGPTSRSPTGSGSRQDKSLREVSSSSSSSPLKRLEMDDGGEHRTNDFSLLCNREFSRVYTLSHSQGVWSDLGNQDLWNDNLNTWAIRT